MALQWQSVRRPSMDPVKELAKKQATVKRQGSFSSRAAPLDIKAAKEAVERGKVLPDFEVTCVKLRLEMT